MNTDMNDFLERERLHNMYWRYSIAIQESRLKQVISRNSKRHNDYIEQLKIAQKNDLTLTLSYLEGSSQQLQGKEETLNDLRSMVFGTELRPAIVRLKYEHDKNLKRSKDATIEKKEAVLKRVKEISQQIPAVREIDDISKNIKNSKAKLKAAEKMAEKERVKIKIDKENHHKDVNGLHKIIHYLNETIKNAEQELQQFENEWSSECSEDSTGSSHKSLVEENAKTPSKDEKEEEEKNLTISPIKIDELDFSMRQTSQSNRAQGDSSKSHHVYGELNLMPNAPNIEKQTAIGDQSFKRAKDTSQSIPAVREIDAISQNIETFSLDQNELASKFNESNLIDDVDSVDEPPVGNALNERCTPKTYSSKWKISRIKPFIDNGDYPVSDMAKLRILATITIDSDSDSDL